jgi:hypothetical protein
LISVRRILREGICNLLTNGGGTPSQTAAMAMIKAFVSRSLTSNQRGFA